MKVQTIPNAEIITIGDELLKGHVLNTNARFLGGKLSDLGFRVISQSSCPDEENAIHKSVKEALRRSKVIVLSGGLGPTPDDLTRDALASFFRVELEFSKPQYSRISVYYKKRGRSVPPLVKREAMFPSNATPLVNKYGIALGFYIESGGSLIVVLPGVPRELERMFQELVLPLIVKKFGKLPVLHLLTVKVAGLSEPDIMQRLGKEFVKPVFPFGIYPAPGEATLRIQCTGLKEIHRLKKHVAKCLGHRAHAFREGSFSESVGAMLQKKHKTVAVAESCTGGLLGEEITRVPGSSRYFKGGVIAYSNSIKTKLLGVSPSLLKKHGAVSPHVAEAMASGVRKSFDATYGVGITGIAGPGGGSRKKPVGMVFVALASPSGVVCQRLGFWGDRVQVRQKAAMKALEMLWDHLSQSR